MDTMKAITHHRYGQPDCMALEEVPRPTPGEGQVLVRVRAASVNPLDWHALTGTPWVMRLGSGLRAPKRIVLGADVAGVVEAVGPGVTAFAVGDEVYGGARGSLAEFAVAGAKSLAAKPPSLTFEQAAALPVAAATALQALRDKAHVQAGQRVLVNGAAGGVGTFAVQIAKALGAEVTAVCSTANVDLVRSLGADHVIDYTTADFAATDELFDVMIDMVGNRRFSVCRRVLKPKGRFVVVGGPEGGRLLGPLTHLLGAVAAFAFSGRRAVPFVAKLDAASLEAISELVAAGKVAPVVSRTYDLADAPEAMRLLMTGHAQGKLVVRV
jgi:NADPH:quinone reductase-like Zn-dependent oxidoreductase